MLSKLLVFSFVFILALFMPMRNGSSDSNVNGRWASDKPDAPMEVDLYFSAPPSLQQETVLNFRVTALQDAPNTEIKIDVPGGFRLISGIVKRVENLSKGETRVYQVVVLPTVEGNYRLSATATSTDGSYVFGKRAELFVQLDTTKSKVSKTDIFAGELSTEAQAEKIGNNSEPPLLEIPDQKPSLKHEPLEILAPGPGQIVVRGYWSYRDKNGVDRPLRDARVEIWDSDTFFGDDLLNTVRTNNSGYYESAAITNSGDEAGTLDIYAKVFSADDISVRVTDFSNNLYYSQTAIFSNVPNGYVEAGSLSVTDVDKRMAFYIYDKIANDAYDYLVSSVGWVNSYNQQVRWSPTSTTGTYYIPGGTIDLLAGDRWDIDVFLHEYGHFVMYKIYGNTLPPSPNCNPHRWGVHSSLGCAWVEGWANYLQAAIQNDRIYNDTEDQNLTIDYEPPVPFADHAEDEGSVAASLWDIYDSGAETWDSLNIGINGTWTIASNNRPNDFIGFYSNWMNSSNGTNSQVTSILQHHDVIPNPVLTASLTFTPGQPYVIGQTVTGKFSITNRGNRSITFEVLTIGGRLNTDSNVVDFPWDTNITIGPNQTYQYSRTFTLQQTGSYRFFPAYRLQGNVWKIGLLSEIPKDAGVIDLLNFTVNSSCNAPGTFSLSAPSDGQSFSSTTTSVPLSWGISANADSYDVYFGTSSNPPLIGNQPGTSRNVAVTPGQYWWKVVAKVNCGSATSTTTVSSFSVQQSTTSSVQFSSATYSVNENAGSRTITVTRTGGTNAFVVNYGTSNGTATAGADYTGLDEVMSFAANETSKTFIVSINDDALVEGNETINLRLSNPTGGVTLGSPSTAVLTIVDNDTSCTYSISSSENTVGPGTGSTNFFMDAPSGCAWSAVSDSTSWLTTSSSGSGDGTVSYNHTANPSTSPRTGHITVGGQIHTVNQIGLGGAGSVQFSSITYSANEGGGFATITVTRTGGTGTGTVNYSTSNGTATAGFDYTPASGLLLFTGSVTSLTFDVPILDDTAFEGSETINLFLSNASNSFTLGNPSTATLTIVDNDNIYTVTPPAGRTSGGQQIILSGTFGGLSTVTMGGVQAVWYYTNVGDTSSITITTPPHSVGAVQIDLTPTSGSVYSKANAFAYLPTVFTDNTIFAAVTIARAQHIIELRQAVDALRAVAGLAPAPWTDPTLSPNSTIIKAVHILELRTYLGDAASRLGYSTSPYTDPTLSTGFFIKRVHIEELRQRIRTIAD